MIFEENIPPNEINFVAAKKKHQYGLIEGIKDGLSAYIKKTFFGKS